jgi:hypothetical protein
MRARDACNATEGWKKQPAPQGRVTHHTLIITRVVIKLAGRSAFVGALTHDGSTGREHLEAGQGRYQI